MQTQIFKSYSDFLRRENKDINGVDQDFADNHTDYVEDNDNNKGCWNCSRCSGCSDCSDLKNAAPVEATALPHPSIMGNYPKIENIHQKVYEAASAPKGLNMTNWHTCDTTHCRAEWVVFLAGEAGAKLEKATSTLFAAMQIYDTSSPISVSPVRFFEDNATALEDMKKCAKLEAQQKSLTGGLYVAPYDGLTKRELIAAMCLQGLLSNSEFTRLHGFVTGTAGAMAKDAVFYADALLSHLSNSDK